MLIILIIAVLILIVYILSHTGQGRPDTYEIELDRKREIKARQELIKAKREEEAKRKKEDEIKAIVSPLSDRIFNIIFEKKGRLINIDIESSRIHYCFYITKSSDEADNTGLQDFTITLSEIGYDELSLDEMNDLAETLTSRLGSDYILTGKTVKYKFEKKYIDDKLNEQLVNSYVNSPFTKEILSIIAADNILDHKKQLSSIHVHKDNICCLFYDKYLIDIDLMDHTCLKIKFNEIGYQDLDANEIKAFAKALASHLGSDYCSSDGVGSLSEMSFVRYIYDKEYVENEKNIAIKNTGLKKTH